MEDMEKNRSEYVARLEQLLAHAQQESAKFKAIAEKWEPRCHAEVVTSEEMVRFTLSFGGKRSTAGITFKSLKAADITTATSAIVDVLIESNVSARLREAVEPEVKRIQPSLAAVEGAGKW